MPIFLLNRLIYNDIIFTRKQHLFYYFKCQKKKNCLVNGNTMVSDRYQFQIIFSSEAQS